MQKILIGLGIAAAAILVAIIAAPVLIPADFLKARIADYVRAKTGRELRIAGPIGVSLVPHAALFAGEVTLSNRPGGTAPNLLELQAAEVSFRLLPLLHGAIEADRIVLTQPKLNLEIDREGRRNWVFLHEPKPAAAPEPAASREDRFSFRAKRIEIAGGAVGYRDQRNGKSLAATAIEMTVTLPDSTGPADALGSAEWNGETVRFIATAASLENLRHGGRSPAIVSVDSAPLSFDFRGDIVRGRPVNAAGTISAKAPSLRRLLAWAGVRVTGSGAGLGPLSLKGKIDIGAAKYALAGATIALDDSTATGDLILDRTGARPLLSGSLALDRLDLNRYLTSAAEPPQTPPPSAPQAPAPAPPASAQKPLPARPTPAPVPILSDTPIKLRLLRSLDADLRLTVNSLRLYRFESEKNVLALRLKDGRMNLDVVEMALYGGKGFGIVVVDGPASVIATNLRLTGVEVQPLFAALSPVDELSGKGDLAFDLRSHGASERELLSALDGSGRIDLADGRITGIDAAQLMTSTVPGNVAKAPARTLPYKTLSASYTISHGILRNGDLRLNSSELTSTGEGMVDLPHCRVDYLWLPNLIGKGSARIAITGPCDDLSYRAMSLTITKGIFPPKSRR